PTAVIVLAIAAALVAAASADPLSNAEVAACLGTDQIAADRVRLATERTKAGAAWSENCADARASEARRRQVISDVLDGSSEHASVYANASKFIRLAGSTRDPDTAELYRRAAQDQVQRESLSGSAKKIFAPNASPLTDVLVSAL